MSTSDSTSCNNKEIDGTSKSSVSDVNDMLQNISTTDKDKDIVSVCANCGKEGDDINNICNKCKMVRYCNAACKKKHRSKHKKQCEEHIRLAAEQSAKLHDIELFKQPPPAEDCSICFIRLPTLGSNPNMGYKYLACCGKVICSGCLYAPVYDNQGNEVDNNNEKCAFCRTPTPKSIDEANEREKKRMEKEDPMAIYNFGVYYAERLNGFTRDYTKALQFWHRAAELGHAGAYASIGYAYDKGRGVEVDKKKALHYYELSAMGGHVDARYNLGNIEENAGNIDRALKHFMIAVTYGDNISLERIKLLYTHGHATKDAYMKASLAYQAYLGDIKSDQRDKASAVYEECRYY